MLHEEDCVKTKGDGRGCNVQGEGDREETKYTSRYYTFMTNISYK